MPSPLVAQPSYLGASSDTLLDLLNVIVRYINNNNDGTRNMHRRTHTRTRTNARTHTPSTSSSHTYTLRSQPNYTNALPHTTPSRYLALNFTLVHILRPSPYNSEPPHSLAIANLLNLALLTLSSSLTPSPTSSLAHTIALALVLNQPSP